MVNIVNLLGELCLLDRKGSEFVSMSLDGGCYEGCPLTLLRTTVSSQCNKLHDKVKSCMQGDKHHPTHKGEVTCRSIGNGLQRNHSSIFVYHLVHLFPLK